MEMVRRVSSKKTGIILTSVLLLLIYFSYVASSQSTSLNKIIISIPGELPQYNESGIQKWVSGIWHYVNITLDENIQKLTLILYKGNNIPVVHDITNYYEWKYDNGNWVDVEYGGYIIKNKCFHKDNFYSFYIGINRDAIANNTSYETWNLNIVDEKSGQTIDAVDIVVEKYQLGIASKSPEIEFYVNPFTTANVTSSHPFGIENIGNVPLNISVTYGSFADKFSTTNFTGYLHVNQTSWHYLIFHAKNLPPGKKKITGYVDGSVPLEYIIPVGATAELYASVRISEPYVTLLVGHSGYELYESPTREITFQYMETLNMKYNEIRNITVYLYGNASVSMRVWTENITLLNIFSGNKTIGDQPFSINVTTVSEYPVIVQVKASIENVTAYLHYEITIGNETKNFVTRINVSPKPPKVEKPYDKTLLMAIVIISIMTVIGYSIYNYIRYRRK
jgi:hypothetical protein